MKNQNSNEMSLPDIDTKGFWKYGYVVIKNVFSEAEMTALRAAAEKTKDNAQGDLLNLEQPELKELVSHPAILHAARSLLGDTPVYFGDSSITYGSFHRGWHKDNRYPDRFKHHYSDWIGRHTMLRFGIYLQDHTEFSGGLGVRQKSHKPSRLVNKIQNLQIPWLETIYNERVKTWLQVFTSCHYGRARLLNSTPGDLLIWNQTTTHSGNALRLKIAPNRKLPTWVENRIPKFLVRPYEKDRISIFLAYAKYDNHLKRGLEFLKKRDYMLSKWEIYKENNYPSTEQLRILNYSEIYPEPAQSG